MQTPSKVTQITIRYEEGGSLHPDFPITLNVSDMELRWFPVFWDDDVDVSLGGNKRSNIRGWDFELNLDYEVSLEPDKVETILDNLVGLIEPDAELMISIDGTDYVELYPLSSTNLNISFSQTVRRGGSKAVAPALHFTSDTLFEKIGDTFQPLS